MQIFLKQIRNEKRYTQQEVADAVGVKLATYRTWENGSRMPSFAQIVACAEFLECTTDELAGRVVLREYGDPRQEMLNMCFENMNGKGKDLLVSVARSMEKDTANRIVKDREEHFENRQGA